MMSAEWIISENTLGLQRGQNIVFPSANDIFLSIREEQEVWPDMAAGAHGAAKNLRFSPYPLLLQLELQFTEETKTIELALTGKAASKSLVLSQFPKTDHLVHGNTWYSVNQSSLEEVQGIAQSAKSGLGVIHSLSAYLALKRASLNGDAILDNTADVEILPLQFLPPDVNSPANVNAQLYPYQKDGWRWLRFVVKEHIGGILADEMGLGKTLQVISMLTDSGMPDVRPALIVAPSSLLENWKREINRFSPSLNILKHHGPLRTGRPAILLARDVVITSYDTVIRDGGLFGMIDWATVILDEAQNIKNPNAARTRAVKALRRKSSLAVTGTPIENRLTDLWSLMDFALSGYLGSLSDFQTQYSEDTDSAVSLERLVSPVILRRRVSEVARDLPERIDIPQAIELEPSEAESYEKMRNDIFEKYGPAATLVSLTNLRMFCAHPALIEPSYNLKSPFSKLTRLNEILEEIFLLGERVIIFTSYIKMADLIKGQIIANYNIFAECLDGRIDISDRQPLIDSFSKVIGSAALILNPKVGGTGLNITAANHVVHYNLEWNPALEDQASARSYRRGQDKPVIVHRLYLAGTVEEVVDERVSRKRNLSGAALVGVSGKDDDYVDIMNALKRSPIAITQG